MSAAEPSVREMSEYLGRLYESGQGLLTRQKRLVSIYRPYYSPVGELLHHVRGGARVLEIGCGTGPILFLLNRFSEIAAGRGLDIDGFDPIPQFRMTAAKLGKPDAELFEVSSRRADQRSLERGLCHECVKTICIRPRVLEHRKPVMNECRDTLLGSMLHFQRHAWNRRGTRICNAAGRQWSNPQQYRNPSPTPCFPHTELCTFGCLDHGRTHPWSKPSELRSSIGNFSLSGFSCKSLITSRFMVKDAP